MSTINREKIHELVGLFYQPTYKTFYVNSLDGETVVDPLGVFVSLGMTTSTRALENIRSFIEGNGKYEATIVEIKSCKKGDKFINTLGEINPKQYKLETLPPSVMTKDEALKELESLKNRMTLQASLEVLTSYSHRVNKLQYLIDRLEESNGWDLHMIQRDGSDNYRIFHLYVNYKKTGDQESRIGILVNEKMDCNNS